MRIACRQLGVFGSVYLFHEDRAVCELLVSAIIFRRARRSVRNMHLIPLRVENHPRAESLILVSIVGRLANVARLIDQRKSVEGSLPFRRSLRVTAQCRECDYGNCCPNEHLMFLLFPNLTNCYI